MRARSILGGAAIAASIAISAEARADEERVKDRVSVRPLMELEASLAYQRLSSVTGAMTTSDTRALWVSRAAAGVDVRLPARLLPLGQLRLTGTLGLGYVYETGVFPVHLATSALWEKELAPRFSLPVGASARVVIDTAAAARSYLEVGIPLGIRYARVEIVYHPTVVVPLGSEARPMLGGARRLGAMAGIAPLGLVLRCVL